jgi:hypothetical protein
LQAFGTFCSKFYIYEKDFVMPNVKNLHFIFSYFVKSFLKYLDIVLCMESLDIFSAALSEQPLAMKREAGLKFRNMFFQKSVYNKNISTVIRP